MTSRRRSVPGTSMSQNGTQTLHKTHSVTSNYNPNIDTSIGGNTEESNTDQKRSKTRYTPRLEAIKKELHNLPNTRVQLDTLVKELGDKVTKPIKNALGTEIGLPTHIRDASVTSSHPEYLSAKFLPNTEVVKLLSHERVKSAITKCNKYEKYPEVRRLRNSTSDIDATVASICNPQNKSQDQGLKVKSYRKLFIILVLLGKASVVTWFIDEGICDDDLPLHLEPKTGDNWQPVRKGGEPFPARVFRKSCYDKFIAMQWLVLAPCFRPSCGDAKDDTQELTNKHIPPFIAWKRIGEGGSSKVYEIKIHHGQHMFVNVPTTGVFAVKVLKNRQPLKQVREHAILRKFNNNGHENMVSILAAYRQHDVYHLILPRALADLHDYWKEVNPSPSETEATENLVWLVAQCQGLAEGLAFIHRYETASFKCLLNPDSLKVVEERRSIEENGQETLQLFGRHGDIKPKNILYFPDHDGDLRGKLVIADFGCTEFSTKEKVHRDNYKRKGIPNTPTYQAPETDKSFEHILITPSYDIWTLGCVYLEFLTWWFGGWALVAEFAAERLAPDPTFYGMTKMINMRTDCFFTITKEHGKSTAEVRDSVKKFMGRIASGDKSNDFTYDFLKLIRTKMLVIESRNGNGTKNGRASAKNIAGYLFDMRKKLTEEPQT